MQRVLRSPFLFLLPLGLWALLWLGLQPGDLKGITGPESFLDFLHSLRAVLPLAAAAAAIAIILARRPWRRQQASILLSPLGLATAYGLVGLFASISSPDATVALYWAAAYLSVPLVLWAVAGGSLPVDPIRRLINAS